MIFHVQSEDDEDEVMEPTRNLPKDTAPSKEGLSERGSETINVDKSDYCFEQEGFPPLKILKVESIVDSEVSQNLKLFR